MSMKPIALYRRRWTLAFSLPFTAMMAVIALYSLYLAFGTSDRFIVLIAGCSAFVSICVGGTIGRSAFEALLDTDPAVVVDERGIEDVKSGIGLIPWHEIARAKHDGGAGRLFVTLGKASSGERHPMSSTMKRVFTGADVEIGLSGLSYSPRELERALVQFSRLSKNDALAAARAARPSDPGFL